jgi:plasmid segregation protein ParM
VFEKTHRNNGHFQTKGKNMEPKHPTVRACDVGYGHIKFTDGRDPESQLIRTASIPSQSPLARSSTVKNSGPTLASRDTFIVPVNGRFFEVGNDVRLAVHDNHVSEILGDDFSQSDAYAARLFGAFRYMLSALPKSTIDILVLGLPLSTFAKHHEAVENRFCGEQVIGLNDEIITIKTCLVVPQPLGSYAAYLSLPAMHQSKTTPMALVVDPGYQTVDWFVCKGMVASEVRSDAVPRGMGAVLRAAASDLIKKYAFDAKLDDVIRMLDRSLTCDLPFEMYGSKIDFFNHLRAGEDVIEEAVQAIKNSVGSGADIDVIILTGGGAKFYDEAVKRKFPRHKVTVLESPALANARGFHLLGEKLAKSNAHSLRQNETVTL